MRCQLSIRARYESEGSTTAADRTFRLVLKYVWKAEVGLRSPRKAKAVCGDVDADANCRGSLNGGLNAAETTVLAGAM